LPYWNFIAAPWRSMIGFIGKGLGGRKSFEVNIILVY
jgi:hypothetical protein